MSQTVDTNVLLYASNSEAPEHGRATALLDHLATGPELVVLLWPVLNSYLRMATHPSIFANPLDHATAVANVESLIGFPHIRTVAEGDQYWRSYRSVTDDVPVRGNGVPDAQLVALMVEHGVGSIWSRDRDFRKYSPIVVRDPFESGFADGFSPT
jgi:toxin-antitoxin system PIN domain toxin